MEKNKLISLIKKVFFFLIFILYLSPDYYKDLIDQGKLDFYNSPVKVFQGFVYDFEDVNPSFIKKYYPIEWREITKTKYDNVAKNDWYKRFSLSTSFLADLSSFFNYYINTSILREGIFIPEIKIGLGHLFYIPIYTGVFHDEYYNTVLESLKFQSFSTSLIFGKSIKPNLKLFGGYRYNLSFLKFNIPSTATFDKKSYDGLEHLHTIVFGISYLIERSNWETFTYIGYSFLEQDVYLKLEANYKFIGIGVGFYPNNIIIFKPYIRFFIGI